MNILNNIMLDRTCTRNAVRVNPGRVSPRRRAPAERMVVMFLDAYRLDGFIFIAALFLCLAGRDHPSVTDLQ